MQYYVATTGMQAELPNAWQQEDHHGQGKCSEKSGKESGKCGVSICQVPERDDT